MPLTDDEITTLNAIHQKGPVRYTTQHIYLLTLTGETLPVERVRPLVGRERGLLFNGALTPKALGLLHRDRLQAESTHTAGMMR